jgi:hypothetical protein
MKTKSDFITNSSSTSFIIASKKRVEQINYTVTSNLLESLYTTVIETIEDLKKEFVEDERDTLYLKLKKIIEDGGTIYMMEAENDGGNPIGSSIHNDGFDINNLENKELILIDKWNS